MVILTVSSILVHMLGCMALFGINANAVSLVNLVMTVGISVEFCSHIIRWFVSCSLPTRRDRAMSALSKMGASVSVVWYLFVQAPGFIHRQNATFGQREV